MNKQETIKFIAGLQTMYPNSFTNADNNGLGVYVDIWQDLMQDYDYQLVMQALKMYIASNTSGFAPMPANIIENIKIMQPKKTMTPNEAYSLVWKAIQNSIWHAQEEYNKLPKEIQSITSPRRLGELAKESNASIHATFEASFKREYEKMIEQLEQISSLPKLQQEQILALKNNNENLKLENKGE